MATADSTTSDIAAKNPRPFALSEGGPFRRLLSSLHLVSPAGRIRGEWLAAFAWLPFALGEAARSLDAGPDPTVFDISVHTRLLVALPVMCWAEWLVNSAGLSALSSFVRGRFCPAAQVDAILARAERARDAWWPEAALAVLALAGGQFALWMATGTTGLFSGGQTSRGLSFPYVWYVAIALPLALFVMFRWLWRWAIWSFILVSIARLKLEPIGSHPDHAGGLGCMARPLSGYALFTFAIGAVLAGAWETQIRGGHATLQSELPTLLWFVLLMLAVGIVPLLPFSGHLYKTRRRSLAQYGDFANEYVRGFQRKWIADTPGTSAFPDRPVGRGEDALGSNDIQSLADLSQAYGVVSKTHLFVFSGRSVMAIAFGAMVPMLPILSRTLTVEDILKRILSAVIGGLPL
jgi:hypothetical protein